MYKFTKISMIIPIALFIIGRWIFDVYSPSIADYVEMTIKDDSAIITNWQVFYYVVLNLSWLIYIANLFFNEYNDDYKLFYTILGFSFGIDLILNLLKINMKFSDYVVSINSIEQNILITGIMSAFLIVFLIKLLKGVDYNQIFTKILTILNLQK